MNLQHAILGQEYYLYLLDGRLSDQSHDFDLRCQATIIAINDPLLRPEGTYHLMLGWKIDNLFPQKETNIIALDANIIDLIKRGCTESHPRLSEYTFGLWVMRNCEAHHLISSLSRECPCGIFRMDCTYHQESP